MFQTPKGAGMSTMEKTTECRSIETMTQQEKVITSTIGTQFSGLQIGKKTR